MTARTLAHLRFALITGTSDECDDGEVAVIDDDTGEVQGCYPDEETAVAAIAETNGETTDAAALPSQAVMVVAREGEMTGDRRIVEPGALSWRELPLALTINHDDDRIAGSVLAMGRTDTPDAVTVDTFDATTGDTGAYVMAVVEFRLDVEDGVYAARLVGENADGPLRGVSMEVGDEVIEWECTETDEDGFCTSEVMHLLEGRIGAVTLTPFQAIESARVLVTADGSPSSFRVVPPTPTTPGVVVAAAVPDAAPAVWFADPELDAPTPVTVTDDGRLFGHIALWGTCHTGFPDRCVTPPPGDDFSLFHLGSYRTAEGDLLPVGTYTIDTGHAPLRDAANRPVSAFDAAAHYDHTGTAAAYVRAGEDEHGIWIAGTLAPGISADVATVMQAAKPSGDWRPRAGRLTLMAVLAVNVPGFPVQHTRSLVAHGEPLALVAASAPTGDGCGCGSHDGALAGRVARLEAVVAALDLDAAAIDALAASIAPR